MFLYEEEKIAQRHSNTDFLEIGKRSVTNPGKKKSQDPRKSRIFNSPREMKRLKISQIDT